MKSFFFEISAVVACIAVIMQIGFFTESPEKIIFKDTANASFSALNDNEFAKFGSQFLIKANDGSNGMPIASSLAVIKFEGENFSSKVFSSDFIESDTLFSTDSITKMITAAAILRMTEEPKYQKFLPQGIDSKLADLLPLLKKYYPQSHYIQNELENEPDFNKITLLNLAQHTSGITPIDISDLNQKLRLPNRKLSPTEIIDIKKAPRTGRYGEKLGEYSYNDFGYELLGRFLVAISSEAENSAQTFSDVVDHLVLNRVKEKISAENGQKLKFFTYDQMELVDGETKVIGHPELEVKFGPYYHDQEVSEATSHLYEMSCGGSYTNPESMSLIAFHILHNNLKFSIFKKAETLEIFNSRTVTMPILNADGEYKKLGNSVYGFGYISNLDPTQKRYRSHSGSGRGANSNVIVDLQDNKAATAMVGFEDLTLPISYALIKEKKATEPVILKLNLYQKSQELSKEFSQEQLVTLRNNLEKSYKNFAATFKEMENED